MYNVNKPSALDLPSSLQLLKSTVIALVVAMILLVTIVMPSEYGIDPTGIGSVTGLKRMGEIKMLLADEAAAEEQAAIASISAAPQAPAIEYTPEVSAPEVSALEASAPETKSATDNALNIRRDEMQVTLEPNEGTEIKVTLAEGKTVEYSWQSSGGPANFDIHGDSVLLDIGYHNYSRGSEQSSSGTLQAAFDGNHGWFWRNRTAAAITVTLTTRGEYTDIQHLQ
jgi:hypothetical protein